MRLVYTADLHGHIASYQALFDLAIATQAHAVIVGGDLLPHAISLQHAIQAQRTFIAEQLQPLLSSMHATHPNIKVYLLPGNDDWAAAITDLDALTELIHPLHERVYQLEHQSATPLWLAGYACVPLTPFSIKDYERRDDGPLPPFSFQMAYTSGTGQIQPTDATEIAAQPSIADALATLAQQSDPRHTIYVCHTPPFDTPLDQMAHHKHVGSRALRSFIEQHEPLLTLHGHIHEAPQLSGQYAVQLGRTWSVNSGHAERHFYAVTLDTDDIAGTIQHTVFGRPIEELHADN